VAVFEFQEFIGEFRTNIKYGSSRTRKTRKPVLVSQGGVGGNVFRRFECEWTEFDQAGSNVNIGDLESFRTFLLYQRRTRDQISQLGWPPMVCIENLVQGYFHTFLVEILASLSDLTVVTTIFRLFGYVGTEFDLANSNVNNGDLESFRRFHLYHRKTWEQICHFWISSHGLH
jgi:hypothetical protein